MGLAFASGEGRRLFLPLSVPNGLGVGPCSIAEPGPSLPVWEKLANIRFCGRSSLNDLARLKKTAIGRAPSLR